MEAEAVFEDLFSGHYQRVAAFAYRLTGDRDTAEDIATDAFAALWNRRDILNNIEHARFFVYRTVRNIAATLARDEQTRKRLLGREVVLRQELDSHNSATESREEVLNEIVRATIFRMPEQRRAVYTLRWEQELSYTEVAELLGLSIKTVEKHVSLALKELREVLTPYLADRR